MPFHISGVLELQSDCFELRKYFLSGPLGVMNDPDNLLTRKSVAGGRADETAAKADIRERMLPYRLTVAHNYQVSTPAG